MLLIVYICFSCGKGEWEAGQKILKEKCIPAVFFFFYGSCRPRVFSSVKIAFMRGEAPPLRCRIVSDPTINGEHAICFSCRVIRGIFVSEVLRKRAELQEKMETTISRRSCTKRPRKRVFGRVVSP